MYNPTPIDKNLRKQPWFNRMAVENRLFLIWCFIDEMDSIGVVEPDMIGFERFYDGLIKASDIDLYSFVEDCNNDGKERMIMLDRGRRLWFSPTILFKNSSNSGFRTLSSSDRDAAIVRLLSEREETRDWLVDQIVYNDRLSIKVELINKVYNRTDATKNERELMERIAKHLAHKIPVSGHSPSEIKKKYGCICQYCGNQFEEYELEIDHIHPRESKHKDVEAIWNKVPACKSDNIKKANKSVLQFLKDNGYDILPSVQTAIDRWVKKGEMDYPTHYPNKRNKKERHFTYDQVINWLAKNPSLKMDKDFELVKMKDEEGPALWRRTQ